MIRIALPNKGRLSESARDLLDRAGLEMDVRGERALQATLAGGAFLALFVRAEDIPEFVADGAADVGITGRDLVAESERPVEELLELGFGRCRVAVAARDDGPATLEDIPSGARVATVFPNITTRYFAGLGRPVTLVAISGAAEIAPHLGVADIIVDLVSTGSTLKMNGLHELATVMESSAVVIARRQLLEAPATERPVRELVAALESVLRARGKRYLMANVPRGVLAEVKRILPGINGPTIVDVMDGGEHVAAHAVVDTADVYRVIAELKALGAEGILVTKIERLMP